MPKYTPILVSPNIRASKSNLIELRWKNNGIMADFIIPTDDAYALRVQFQRVEIVSLLDEMPLSTESEETLAEGLVPENFSYSVEGAIFWRYQSEALKASNKGLTHYRFVTGWMCLDVISNREPAFAVVPVSKEPAA